jgi:uncharacterized protein (DUF1015 family)
LKLLRAAEANLSSVFLLYEDREDQLGELLAKTLVEAPLGHAIDGAGVVYRLARMTDPQRIATLERFLAERPSVIADGHHRYETALEYRRQQIAIHGPDADAPWQSTIAYFANAYAPGSLLLPIHRVVRDLPAPSEEIWRNRLPDWTIRRLRDVTPDGIVALLAEALEPLADRPAFLVESAGGPTLLIHQSEPRPKELMVRIVEREILGGVFGLDPEAIRGGAVRFPKSAVRAAREIREGQGTVAIYLNPLTPDDVFRVTAEGEVMPQKSTFFYPKIPTGMVLRDHRESGSGAR